jgi:hypothetical protein
MANQPVQRLLTKPLHRQLAIDCKGTFLLCLSNLDSVISLLSGVNCFDLFNELGKHRTDQISLTICN